MLETFRISGLQDLERRLLALPEKVQRVTLIKACREAAVPILTAAQSKVPRDTGLLARSIKVKFTHRAVTSVEASIGVFGLSRGQRGRIIERFKRKGLGLPDARQMGDPYYALWVEKGHDILVGGRRRVASSELTKGQLIRRQRQGVRVGRVAGHVAARPFLRPALDENAQQATNIVAQVIRDELDNAERL